MSYKITDDTGLAFNELDNNYKKNRRRVMMAGAKTFQQKLIRNTPVDLDTSVNARDETAISNVRTDKDTREGYIAVGYTRKVSHRVHVTEFGSMYQRPQGFITRTYNEGIDEAYNAMLRAARRML